MCVSHVFLIKQNFWFGFKKFKKKYEGKQKRKYKEINKIKIKNYFYILFLFFFLHILILGRVKGFDLFNAMRWVHVMFIMTSCMLSSSSLYTFKTILSLSN